MKKGSVALKVFLYASLFSLVWLGAYVGLSGVFSVAKPSAGSEGSKPQVSADVPETVSSYWSVLAVVDEEQKVTEFFLRYADFLEDALVFVEVPTDTKVELPAGGYEVLSVHNPEIPELFMVSELCGIFSEETLCMAATETAAGILGIRPKACYLLEETFYDTLTEQTGEGKRFLKPVSVKDTIVMVSKQSLTDRTLEEELVYAESYRDVKTVVYRELPGKSEAEEYIPDWAGIKELVELCRTGRFTEEE